MSYLTDNQLNLYTNRQLHPVCSHNSLALLSIQLIYANSDFDYKVFNLQSWM